MDIRRGRRVMLIIEKEEEEMFVDATENEVKDNEGAPEEEGREGRKRWRRGT